MPDLRRVRRFGRGVRAAAFFTLLPAAIAAAQQIVINDQAGDTVIRRTDEGNVGTINPNLHRLPDILQMRMGKFAPAAPDVDLFFGDWSNTGLFVRFDLVLYGVINPPGPMGDDFKNPTYSPFMYGPNPIYGWIEFDIDNNINTGGELNNPELRYDGAIARLGGKPVGPAFADRVATSLLDIDPYFDMPPYVERSGEEFHLTFRGEDVQTIDKANEKPGGDPNIFENGEQWTIRGPLWHRAHLYERYAFRCVGQNGVYMPNVSVRFRHENSTNQTTISLVYPLNNTAAGLMESPYTTSQPNNGCPGDQNSIEEALEDLHFSALFTDPQRRSEPEFAAMIGWESISDVRIFLDPGQWRVDALIGTGYPSPLDGARYAWTDAWPNCRVGDFNGDGEVDEADAAMLAAYIAERDGDPDKDADGVVNGRVVIPGFAANFSIFDTNYDGVVGPEDTIVLGDMNINLVVNYSDISDFVQALINPTVYTSTHGGASPLLRGDLNGDHRLDGKDIPLMLNAVGCH